LCGFTFPLAINSWIIEKGEKEKEKRTYASADKVPVLGFWVAEIF
jgi:hypothetical protein